MIKSIPLTIIFFVLLSSAGANEGNEKLICEQAYYFLIDNLESGNVINYVNLSIDDFSDLLYDEKDINVTDDVILNVTVNDILAPYIFNYTSFCSNYSDLVLPEIKPPIVKIEKPDTYHCEARLDKTMLGFYDLDWSIPIPEIHRGRENCQDLERWKWLMNYKRTGKYDYSVVGIKIWVFIVLSFLFFGMYIFKENTKLNRLIKQYFRRLVGMDTRKNKL